LIEIASLGRLRKTIEAPILSQLIGGAHEGASGGAGLHL
jgi:hypothetical protein